jgi:peptidoglycan/xylan/chitin deacetylase (PgdA/CDA1 family)
MFSSIITGISAGLGATALTAGGCAYAANWPGSQIFGKTLIAPASPEELALTFDDGPNPAWTPRLLDILARHDVRATFFLVGSFAQSQPNLVRQIVAAGHRIGNHSWSHPNLSLCSSNRIHQELSWTSETLQEITGTPVKFFRPPYGARRPAVLRTARHLGMTPVLWNAMTNDWSEPASEAIVRRLSRSVDRRNQQGRAANIVLHDGGHRELGVNRGPSVAAADALVARYKSSHRFVTLDAWYEAS